MGAERGGGFRRGRVQRLGQKRFAYAEFRRHLVRFSVRTQTVRHLQVRRDRQVGQDGVQMRPVRSAFRDCARQRVETLRHFRVSLEGPQVDERPQELQSLRLSDEHLRGSPRQLAQVCGRQLSELHRNRGPAHSLRQEDGVYAHRAYARHGVSLSTAAGAIR